jgi:5'-3' exonuclease
MTTVAHTDNHPDSIALVDLGYLFKKIFVVMSEEPVAEIARAVIGALDHLRRGVGHVIVCRDAPPYMRASVFPDYKAHRPKPTTEETAAKRRVFEEIQRLGFNVAWCQGFEADDVIATLAKAYGEWCPDVRIVGPDKDMAQCITDNVRQFIPPIGDKDWEVRDVAGVVRKWGVTPELMPFYQALVGDKSDNVPGVPGIGPVNAKKLVNAYPSAVKLATAMAEAASSGSVPAPWAALAAHYESGFILSLKLVTLATNVPVDLESLLVPRAAEPAPRSHNNMDVEFDGYVGNETPMVPPDAAVFDRAKQIYDAQFTSTQESANDQTTAAKDEALLEKEYDRERGEQNEADASSNDPGDKGAERVAPPKSVAAPKAAVPAPRLGPPAAPLVKTAPNYGLVNADLQPCDLAAAYQVSEWLLKGGLYPQFKTTAQIFTVIARGKELGIGMTTALANTHIIDGKPVSHADLIRALAERDDNFGYLMPVKMSATECVWEGKHKGQPCPVTLSYTIEEARAAGLCRSANYGKPGNWEKRPQDMLNKTAASKLARLLWPGATMGLYCAEEMGYSEEELSEREAA